MQKSAHIPACPAYTDTYIAFSRRRVQSRPAARPVSGGGEDTSVKIGGIAMEEYNILLPLPEPNRASGARDDDLDDLIFRGEGWLASDR